jgi:hypothetical protein
MSESEPPRPRPHGGPESGPASRAPAEPAREDIVFVGGPAESGEGLRVLRKREDTIEVGEIRPVQEGRPLQGELVRLKPRREHDRVFDVEVLLSRDEIHPRAALGHAGPAQVATDAYRTNWDAIFGAGDEQDLPN